jgi:hypothetical protein
VLSISRLSLPRVSSPGGIGVLVALLVCLGLLLHLNFSDKAEASVAPEAMTSAAIDSYSIHEVPATMDEFALGDASELCIYVGMLCVLVTLLLTRVVAIRAPRDERVDEGPIPLPTFSKQPGPVHRTQPRQVALRI